MAQQDEHRAWSPQALSRRSLLQQAALGVAAAAGISQHAEAADEPKPPTSPVDFPVIDYHVHLSGTLTIDRAVELAQTRSVKFGIVEHPSPEGKLANDNALRQYLDMLQKYPVYRGVQPVYPNWAKAFSKDLLAQLDYILMDALTLPEKDGRWLAIWRPETAVPDKQAFMTRYFEFIQRLLTEEPIDIFAWPTYLPTCISQDYDVLWTDERLHKLVELVIKRDIAIELNEFAKVPKARFITMAKEAGAKFTFGTDSRDARAGKFDYCLQMIQQCGLTAKHMFTPKPDGQKAIQRMPKV